MKYDKFINYIGTISYEPSKYNLSILLLAFSVYMIFYIVKQRHKARKSMKQNNKQKQ